MELPSSDVALKILGRGTLRAPFPLLRLLGGAPRINDRGAVLDRQAQSMLALERLLGFPPVYEHDDPLVARRATDKNAQLAASDPVEIAHVEDLSLPGPESMLGARFYRPQATRPPAMLYLHGGGWVVGSPDSHDVFCRRLCRDAEIAVLSLDYRLAPEHPWPCGREDAFAAWQWLVGHTDTLEVDASRLTIGGDSAGGNLSALVSLACRDAGVPAPFAQLLIYPGLDLTRSAPSHELFATGFYLDRRSMDWYSDQYVDPGLHRDPGVSPLFADDVSELPHTLIVNAGFDPLRDEATEFTERLVEGGVTVDAWTEHTLIHGFINMDGLIEAAARARDEIVRRVRVALAR